MEKGRRHVNPEQMTSAERLERIIEILVGAGLKLSREGDGSISFNLPDFSS